MRRAVWLWQARSLTLVEDLGVVEHLELLGGVLARIHERCLDSARVVAEEVGEVIDLVEEGARVQVR